MADIITNPHWGHWFFGVALVASLLYGFGAFKIHQATIPTGWAPRLHQYWLNFLGAAVGWLAGWVVLNRWLACPAFMCADEPRIATGVLAVGAFIGMVGLLPLTVVTGVAALKSLLETYFKKLTTPDPKSTPASRSE